MNLGKHSLKTRAAHFVTGKHLRDRLQREMAVLSGCALLLLAAGIYQIVAQPGSPWTYLICACWGGLMFLYGRRIHGAWQILHNPLFYLLAIKHDLGTPPERNQSS